MDEDALFNQYINVSLLDDEGIHSSNTGQPDSQPGSLPFDQNHPMELIAPLECDQSDPAGDRVFDQPERGMIVPAPLACNWPNCPSTTTFTRRSDLTRHMQKHNGDANLNCPVKLCAYKDRRSFYRPDKLADHLRRGHDESEYCNCPLEKCSSKDLTVLELRLHLNRAHSRDNRKLAQRFQRALPLPLFLDCAKCELKKCKRWIRGIDVLQKHLNDDHSHHDRVCQSDMLYLMGFDPATLQIICPICKERVPNQTSLMDHFERLHLYTNLEHWMALKRELPPNGCQFSRYWSSNFLCPYCGIPASSLPPSGSNWIDHHLSLLEKSGDILRYRDTIARLIPKFLNHPVFDDVCRC